VLGAVRETQVKVLSDRLFRPYQRKKGHYQPAIRHGHRSGQDPEGSPVPVAPKGKQHGGAEDKGRTTEATRRPPFRCRAACHGAARPKVALPKADRTSLKPD